MNAAEYIVGRTVRDVIVEDYSNVVTLVLEDGTHYRLTAVSEYDGGITVDVLDARLRVAEAIARRVEEFEEKAERARSEIRREEQRIVRERMERLLKPKAYREWLKRHQPWYIMDKALKAMWTGPALTQQLYDADPLIGRIAKVPVTK